MTFFTADEMKCKCGTCDGESMNEDFMTKLNELRTMCGFPFIVTSAFRCEVHNKNVGGSPSSMHLEGRAADIAVQGEQAYEVLKWAEVFGFRGIGIIQNENGHFLHLDDREVFAMWTY